MHKPEWLKKSAQRAAQQSALQIASEEAKSVARCPGIRKIFSEGWVVYNWMDVYIKVGENGEYEWRSSVDQKNISPIKVDYVNVHLNQSFAASEFLGKKVPVFKFVTPWLVKVPTGYTLIQKGMPYQEHDMFTVGEGLVTNEYGITAVSIQLLWNKPGEYILPAGMPLAHLMLVKTGGVREVIRNATKEEVDTHLSEAVLKYLRWLPSYKEVKQQIADFAKCRRG